MYTNPQQCWHFIIVSEEEEEEKKKNIRKHPEAFWSKSPIVLLLKNKERLRQGTILQKHWLFEVKHCILQYKHYHDCFY